MKVRVATPSGHPLTAKPWTRANAKRKKGPCVVLAPKLAQCLLEVVVRSWNRSKIPSAQKCYPCSRYKVLPMFPGWTIEKTGGADRIRTHDLLDAIESSDDSSSEQK
jgi:hypothetical protein